MAIDTSDILLRKATGLDVPEMGTCVNRAYQHYIERIGKPPAPMLEDYWVTIKTCEVFVAEYEGHVVGLLVLRCPEEGFLLDNIAVDPEHQGKGIGQRLLTLAESHAKESGFDSIYLYTNEEMVENRQMYTVVGFQEYAHRVEQGLSRVYMRKRISNVAV